ncbi:hypothetical protein [Sporosarcina jiandibaonis]|uniref:hypothetical protein n=1 Tax=Sporosarcina jiandibaonis TaxID=2715535 RepID=UPI0015532525|nr:hypothetical protein [Sporosarcina jiandibaonis]
MKFNNQFSGNEFQSNDSPQDIGPKIAFLGSVITVIGDTLAVIGGAIALEESKIADQQQQQEMAKLQSQIDDLQKQQSQNNGMSIDVEKFSDLLERMLDRLESADKSKGANGKIDHSDKNYN